MSKQQLLDKLRQLLKNRLLSNMIIVGSVTMLVSLTGFYKELVVGSTYGLSTFLDTFTLAVLLPGFIQSVFVNALNHIFIPNYIIERETSNKIGGFQSVVVLIITGIVAFFTITILIFNEFFMELLFPGHDPDFYHSIRQQLYIVLPALLFWGYSGFLTALLEIKGKFMLVSIEPISVSLTTLASIYLFKNLLGEKVLAFGMLSGAVLGFAYLLVLVFRFKLLKLEKPIYNENVKGMIRQLPPKTISGLLTSINPFVDKIFAAQLVAGSVISLSFGNKIPAFGVSIVMVALGNVLLPHFSELVIKDLRGAFRELFKILKWVFMAAIVAVAILMVFSHEIIALLFERNQFTKEDTEIVGTIQQLLLLHVPFYIVTRILVKFLTSINKNSFMAFASFINLILNIVFNFILVRTMGVYGLALSTSIVLTASSLMYFGFTYREFKKLGA